MRWQCKILPFALLLACGEASQADGQGTFPVAGTPQAVNLWSFERPQVYAPTGYNPYGGRTVAATPPGDRLTLQYAPVVGGTLPGPASQALYPSPMGSALGLPPYGGFGTAYGQQPGAYGQGLSPWGGPPLNGLPGGSPFGGSPFGGGFWPGFW